MRKGLMWKQRSGRWAIHLEGGGSVELTSGAVFLVEDDAGVLRETRMEFRHFDGGGGEYYSVDGLALRGGMRAALAR